MKKTLLLLITLTFFQHFCYSQTKKMDSLKTELQNAKQDTTRIKIIAELCNICEVEDNLKYGEMGLNLAVKLISAAGNKEERKRLLKQKRFFRSVIKIYYKSKLKSSEYLEYMFANLQSDQESNDTLNCISDYRALSSFYHYTLHDKQNALKYLNLASELATRVNDKGQLASIYNDLGLMENDSAIISGYLRKSFKLYIETGNKKDALIPLWNLGTRLGGNKNYAEALNVLNSVIKIARELKDSTEIKSAKFAIAGVYAQMGKEQEALELLFAGIKGPDAGDSLFFIQSYLSIADIYKKKGNYSDAVYHLKLAAGIGKRHKIMGWLPRVYEELYSVEQKSGDWKGAFEHMELYNKLEDSLAGTEEIKKAAELKNDYEQKQRDLLVEKEAEKQKIIRDSFIVGFALMLLLAGVSFNSYRRKQKSNKIISIQKTLVEEKQKEILDSIEYALRIQTAILPQQKIVKQYLENSFILYKPKDIVAGDFYWMEIVNDLVLFAACDCTGHGVPGAMVSVVCHNALNRAVREFGLTQPAAILDKTAEIVIENFSKSEEDIKDGMDISLCSYNTKTKELNWAGANNPLWLLQNGELIETKADKQPIGMNEDSKPFTNHTFNLKTTDTIYLFTDGFADQFGGDTGQKKLTKKRFKDLILSLQNKTLQEQGIALDKFITDYRKEVEQIDDILVMGVKV